MRHGLSQNGDKLHVAGIPHDFEVRILSLPPAAFVKPIPREVVVHDVHRIARLLHLRGMCGMFKSWAEIRWNALITFIQIVITHNGLNISRSSATMKNSLLTL